MIKFLGVYDYTVILTYMSLISAIVGITQAAQGHYTAAILCLLLSGICDAFDGTVARSKKNRTDDEKAFGIQLDSLCDVVSFGLAPALICFFLGMKGFLGKLILSAYCICGVIRLAWFNVLEAKRQQTEDGCGKEYRGLPITSASIVLPITYLLRFLLKPSAFLALLHVVMALLGLLFILDFRVPKPNIKKLLVKAKLMQD